jgi:hypothetical protein
LTDYKYNLSGSNKMQINQKTAINAFQLWVDTYMAGDHNVLSVKQDNSNYHDGFIITLDTEATE